GVTPPSTNVVTVRVSDDGVPSLSATAAVKLIVLGAPGFGSATLNGTTLTVSWPAIAGRTYRLVSRTNLTDGVWEPYGADLPAAGGSVSADINTASGPHRFFRVLALP
ncbi:MAG: hypothetical protein HZA90_28055, partial [Verrucomicrobia bacterium]|nr:hypothetical protein [Verrucomicrobiota bacterium]